MALLDSSLRDGAQAEGITFSVEDKIKILLSAGCLRHRLRRSGRSDIQSQGSGILPEGSRDLAAPDRPEACGVWQYPPCATAIGWRKMSVSVRPAVRRGTPGGLRSSARAGTFHVTDIIQTTLEENLGDEYEGDDPVCQRVRGGEVDL